MTDNLYMTNESGVRIKLRAIDLAELETSKANIEQEYRDRGEPIDPPTYTVTVEGGDTFDKLLDERVLESMGEGERKNELTLIWISHLSALQEMRIEQGKVEQEFILDGIDVQLPEDDTWERIRKRRHINVPEDPIDKLLYYKKHILLPTPQDAITATTNIYKISSSGAVSEAMLAAMQNLFRRRVDEAAAWVEEEARTAGVFTDKDGELGAEPLYGKHDGGEGMGIDSEPVRVFVPEGTGKDD